MSLDLVPPPPPGHRPPPPSRARWSLALAGLACAGLLVHPELGWIALLSLGLGVAYAFAPVTEPRPLRMARGGLALSLLALTVAGVDFTIHHAVPGILAGGRQAAAKTAVSTLRTLYWAQGRIKEEGLIDTDGDGVGEYAFIGELAGLAQLRGGRPALVQPIIENKIGALEGGPHGGFAVIGPYCYAIYLPGGIGVASEAALGGAGATAVDADGAERAWIGYAWPLRSGASATLAYFINEREEVLETANTAPSQGYSGALKMPAWDAALPEAAFGAPVDGERRGDGGTWHRWKNKKARPTPAGPQG